MTSDLIAIVEGLEMGRIARDNQGNLSFAYNEKWCNAPDAHPLSISLPLNLVEHGHVKIETFLWGLLPDDDKVITQWARRFQVSARNVFGLIAAVGEECAGAVQFVRPERLDAILGHEPAEIEWLDENSIAERLGALRNDHSAWRSLRDTGQFSLAGAQPKTALLLENGRWGVPSGRVPTTHIFKPPTGEFDGHAENEHFCLELARALGLPVVDSTIMRFQEEIAIVVERYDRIRMEEGVRRVHQEDMCQALAVSPTRKYQNDGGPGIRDIVELLQANSSHSLEDVRTFLDAIAFNWLIAGTDAHAKNYALLIPARARARFAPLYDLASALPYKDMHIQKLKLAMKLGGEYRLRDIALHNWQKLAGELRIDADVLTARVADYAAQLPDKISEVKQRMTDEGLTHPIIARLADVLVTRAADCRRLLGLAQRPCCGDNYPLI